MKIIPKFLCLIFIILFKSSLAARHTDIKVLPFEQGYTSFFPVNFRQSNSNTGPESTCDGKKDSSALLIFKKDIYYVDSDGVKVQLTPGQFIDKRVLLNALENVE